MSTNRIAILGAGLSGLSSAWFLRKVFPHASITVLESSSRVGGWVNTSLSRGAVFELGPRTIRPAGFAGAVVLEIIRDLGLRDEVVSVSKTHVAAQNRFVYDHEDEKLVRMPGGVAELVKTLFTPGLLGIIPPAIWQDLTTAYNSPDPAGDESIDSLLRRRFGADLADRIGSAITHGIYAADSRELSVKACMPALAKMSQMNRSVVLSSFREQGLAESDDATIALKKWERIEGNLIAEMKTKSIYTFRKGLSTLTDKMQEALKSQGVEFRLRSDVQSLSFDRSEFKISTNLGQPLHCDRVVSALPSNKLHTILKGFSGSFPQLVYNASASVAVVNILLPKIGGRQEKGFGYLIPRSKSRENSVLGVVFDSDALGTAQNDPQGTERYTVMIGGPHWTGLKALPSEEELLETAMTTLRKHLHLDQSMRPLASLVSVQPECIPTYAIGHDRRMSELHTAISDTFEGRLALAGASYAGVSINDVARSGWEIANTCSHQSLCTGLERFSTRPQRLLLAKSSGGISPEVT